MGLLVGWAWGCGRNLLASNCARWGGAGCGCGAGVVVGVGVGSGRGVAVVEGREWVRGRGLGGREERGRGRGWVRGTGRGLGGLGEGGFCVCGEKETP